jgi:hypothetical protein
VLGKLNVSCFAIIIQCLIMGIIPSASRDCIVRHRRIQLTNSDL